MSLECIMSQLSVLSEISASVRLVRLARIDRAGSFIGANWMRDAVCWVG